MPDDRSPYGRPIRTKSGLQHALQNVRNPVRWSSGYRSVASPPRLLGALSGPTKDLQAIQGGLIFERRRQIARRDSRVRRDWTASMTAASSVSSRGVFAGCAETKEVKSCFASGRIVRAWLFLSMTFLAVFCVSVTFDPCSDPKRITPQSGEAGLLPFFARAQLEPTPKRGARFQ
jgi:hypothetical protein